MSAVGEVETLVADREIRDALAAHGQRQRQPVVEARVLDLVAAQGALRGYKIKDPSLHNWLALALAVRGEGISDFPICNKSFNLSYCGHDL